MRVNDWFQVDIPIFTPTPVQSRIIHVNIYQDSSKRDDNTIYNFTAIELELMFNFRSLETSHRCFWSLYTTYNEKAFKYNYSQSFWTQTPEYDRQFDFKDLLPIPRFDKSKEYIKRLDEKIRQYNNAA